MSSYVQVTTISWDVESRSLHVKVSDLPLSWFVREGIRVITQQSSKQNYKNNSCTQFAGEEVGL